MIWDFDPVAFSVLGFPIRWYGLVYMFGALLALYWGQFLQQKILAKPFSKTEYEQSVFGTFLWGIVGGRLGHFLFYEPEVFWHDPYEILQVWHGGMSIHGGLLGGLIFVYFWSRSQRRSFFEVTDVLVIPLAMTLIFGRGANFINGELWGKPTGTDWGVVFPHVDEHLRHPTQLYESAKNIILLSILLVGYRLGWGQSRGVLTSVFLLGYGVFRFIIEFWKDIGWTFLSLNTGQWLCVVMMIVGGGILIFHHRQKR